jgi:hypothetical protein
MAKQKLTRCYYPECQLCCKQDGYECGIIETHNPRTQLLKGVATGFAIALFIYSVILLIAVLCTQ